MTIASRGVEVGCSWRYIAWFHLDAINLHMFSSPRQRNALSTQSAPRLLNAVIQDQLVCPPEAVIKVGDSLARIWDECAVHIHK